VAADEFHPPFDIVHVLPTVARYTGTQGLRQLIAWWQEQGSGVCCVAGIGGSGKTAAVDEFLRRIHVFTPRPGLDSLPLQPPRAAFVFTLAQGSVDILLDELRRWVPGGSGSGLGDLVRDLGQVARGRDGRVLIVIDGFESLQSNGGHDGFGRITDVRLRDLVVRCAHGAMPGVGLLLTSRLAMSDVEIQRLPWFTRVDFDAIDPGAAVDLLRAAGLLGSDRELSRIAETYGHHALTLSLVAQYAERTGRLPATGREETATNAVVQSYLDLTRSDGGGTDLVDLLSLFSRGASTAFLRRMTVELGLGPLHEADRQLQRLFDLRVAARTTARADEDVVTMHQVVRAAVHDTLRPEQRRAWHSSIAQVLTEDLDVAWEALDVSSRFDRLEDLLTQLAQGDDPMRAFLLYWQDIGNFHAVGHESSRYGWGEHACRIINQDRPPDELAPYLGLNPSYGSALLSDWALYLAVLGETSSALVAHEASYQIASVTRQVAQLPVSAANIADAQLQRGALGHALDWAERARRHAVDLLREYEGIPTREGMEAFDESFDWLARATLYSRGAPAATEVLNELAATHAAAAAALRAYRTQFVPLPNPPRFDLERFRWGKLACEVMLARGDFDEAVRVAQLRLDEWAASGRGDEATNATQRILLASALLGQGRGPAALPHIEAVETWARTAEASVTACEGHLLRAKLALLEDDPVTATESAEAGLAIARETGSGLLHIRLLVQLSLAALRRGQPDEAAHSAATALFGQDAIVPGVALYQAPARDERSTHNLGDEWYAGSGVFPPPESGRPSLLAATHPDCMYRCGEASARVALAEALLTQLARHSGQTTWSADGATAEATAVIRYANTQLQRAVELFDELSGSSSMSQPVRTRISELGAGTLTSYPLASLSAVPTRAPAKRRILISYSRQDSEFVDRLADALELSLGSVWLDRRSISTGQSFIAAINNALTDVTDFVVVLSATAITSRWVQNELGAAIALRNAGQPLTIHPVLLDGVTAPPLIADLNAVRPLNRDPLDAAARLLVQ
jgi:hypothetical protein